MTANLSRFGRCRLFFALALLTFAPTLRADDLVAFGRQLFFDTDLSAQRNQSCSTCHNPVAGFIDTRDNGVAAAASLGSDGVSLGERNAPTVTYAALVPAFGIDATGVYAGGLFHDGRAATLARQAAEPFTNPVEMAMPSEAAVVQRVLEKETYFATLEALFGAAVLADPAATFAALTAAIAAYESSPEFVAFDSRYDRFLRGEYELTRPEEIGRMLFFSQVINCHSCHLVDAREHQPDESFTNFRYHNIGTPRNDELARANGSAGGSRDEGLLANPLVRNASEAGKFRVPTLRNVAVTAPYMHNGVFRELETAVRFYNRYTLIDEWSQRNPETGRRWRDAEVPATVDFELLRAGQPMSEMQVQAILAFLRALTDRRYERLVYGDTASPGK